MSGRLIVYFGAATKHSQRIAALADDLGVDFTRGESASTLLRLDPDLVVVEVASEEQLGLLDRMMRRRLDPELPVLVLIPRDANLLLEATAERGAAGQLFFPVRDAEARSTLDAFVKLSRYQRGRNTIVPLTDTHDEIVSEWKALVSSAPNVILHLDGDGVIRYANRAIFPGEEPKGKTLDQLFPDLPGTHERIMERTIQHGLPSYIETIVDHPDYGEHHFDLFLGPIVGGNSITGVAAVVADTTARHRDELAVRESEAQLQTLLQTAPGLIRVVDREGRVLFQNHDAKNEELGESLAATADEEFRETLNDAIARAAKREAVAPVIYRADGVWYEARMRRVDFYGRSGVFVFSIDITQRKNLEERLLHASKMEAIGRLAGGVAHDFNNLLTSIVNYAWYVRDELPEESPLREDLAEVLKAAESGARLTRDLLAFSRRRPARPTRVDLRERTEQMFRVLQRSFGDGMTMQLETTCDAPLEIEIEPGQIDQILFNLAANSRDAMPDGGHFTVSLARRESMAELVVEDDGPGIDPEIWDRVFEPFFSTKGPQGSGLGLATCYGIVRQAGGTIELESRLGAGARFRISLPLLSNEVASTGLGAASEPLESRLALVVEDQPPILKLVRRALEHAGWEVMAAGTAEDAIEIADRLQISPAVLLTDVALPGMNGIDLSDALRRRWPDLPVVLTSGYLGDDLEPALGTDRRTTFVPKPFTSVELLSRLTVLLD